MLAYITEIVHKCKVNYRCGRLPYTYNGLNTIVFSYVYYLQYSFSGLALDATDIHFDIFSIYVIHKAITFFP